MISHLNTHINFIVIIEGIYIYIYINEIIQKILNLSPISLNLGVKLQSKKVSSTFIQSRIGFQKYNDQYKISCSIIIQLNDKINHNGLVQ